MRRLFRKIFGFAILIVGVVMSVPVLVPGWGLPVILVGLGILAPEYEWARRLNQKALGFYHRILARMKSKHRKDANQNLG